MRTYSVGQVERLLRSYLSIRNVILGNAPQQGADNPYLTGRTAPVPDHRRPLGMGPMEGRPWPMMEPRHARKVRDGKAQARAREDLHCAVIDIETALAATDRDGVPLLSRTDRWLLVEYFIYGNYTLDELCALLGTVSRGSMQRRCQRALERLVAVMDGPEGVTA